MIADNDYNLNIRRYVDNTPDPEAEDVQAHLIGGIPNQEIEELKIQFAKFGLKTKSIFSDLRENYLQFNSEFSDKSKIKSSLEENSSANRLRQLVDKYKIRSKNNSDNRMGSKSRSKGIFH